MAEKMVKKSTKENEVLPVNNKNHKEDDVLNLIDEELESSSKKKSKRTVSSTKGSSISSSKTLSSTASTTEKVVTVSENESMMTILKQIQENQKQQDLKLRDLATRVDEIYEEAYQEDSYYDNEQDGNDYEPPAKVPRTQSDNNDANENNESNEPDNTQNRFSGMVKRSKQKEIKGPKIDEVLASTITDLFRNGMDESQYSEMMKDEKNPRPENCEGLVVVKTNKLIWDLMSPQAQTGDKKLQNIERSLIKASILLANTVNKCALLEQEKGPETDNISDVIDECNDVLAILGHTNRQINLTRREFIKLELNNEYTHLCAQSQPFTSNLFGDDVSKVAKDIEDCSKIANKIHYGQGGRSWFRPSRFSRGTRGSYRGRFPRGRGNRSHTHERPSVWASSKQDTNAAGNADSSAKNYPKRGAGRGYRRQ